MVEVPEVVRNKAIVAGASAWLGALPAIVADLEAEWSLRVGRAFETATEAFVAEATCEDGMPAVLKLVIPRQGEQARAEITALRLAGGEACAQLLCHDAARGALLLERLGRPLSELGVPLRDRHEILCRLAMRLWRAAPGSGLQTGAEKALRLRRFIETTWERIGMPCSERAVEYALDCAGRRHEGYDEGRAVLVHGDLHQWNTLEAGSGFKLVDPDGLVAEPEYDLGIIMREDPAELVEGDPRDRSRWLAARTGLDETAIWEWGVVERVATGLLAVEVGLQPVGDEMLRAAERVAGGAGLP